MTTLFCKVVKFETEENLSFPSKPREKSLGDGAGVKTTLSWCEDTCDYTVSLSLGWQL